MVFCVEARLKGLLLSSERLLGLDLDSSDLAVELMQLSGKRRHPLRLVT